MKLEEVIIRRRGEKRNFGRRREKFEGGNSQKRERGRKINENKNFRK